MGNCRTGQKDHIHPKDEERTVAKQNPRRPITPGNRSKNEEEERTAANKILEDHKELQPDKILKDHIISTNLSTLSLRWTEDRNTLLHEAPPPSPEGKLT
jgi:hypothetical protein